GPGAGKQLRRSGLLLADAPITRIGPASDSDLWLDRAKRISGPPPGQPRAPCGPYRKRPTTLSIQQWAAPHSSKGLISRGGQDDHDAPMRRAHGAGAAVHLAFRPDVHRHGRRHGTAWF